MAFPKNKFTGVRGSLQSSLNKHNIQINPPKPREAPEQKAELKKSPEKLPEKSDQKEKPVEKCEGEANGDDTAESFKGIDSDAELDDLDEESANP